MEWFRRGLAFSAGVAVAAAIVALLLLGARIFLLVFIAIVFATGLEPAVEWVRQRAPFGRVGAILATYAAFLVVVVVVVLVVAPGAIAELGSLVDRLPPLVDQLEASVARLRPQILASGLHELIQAARNAVGPSGPNAGQVVEVGLTVADALVSVGAVLALVFFWLTEGARLQRYVLSFLPGDNRAEARRVWNEVEARLGRWVRGQLVLMAAIGLAAGIAYFLLGLESALLLGTIAALAEAIPIVGPLLGALPALLVAATDGPEKVILVAAVYVVLQLLEGNFLVPLVMRNAVGLSPFLVLVSLLVGAAVAGVIGAFVAVPIVAAAVIIIEGLQSRDVPVAQEPGTLGGPRNGDASEGESRPQVPPLT